MPRACVSWARPCTRIPVPPIPGGPQVKPPRDRERKAYPTQGAVLMHGHEELAPHLGHHEGTRDVVMATR